MKLHLFRARTCRDNVDDLNDLPVDAVHSDPPSGAHPFDLKVLNGTPFGWRCGHISMNIGHWIYCEQLSWTKSVERREKFSEKFDCSPNTKSIGYWWSDLRMIAVCIAITVHSGNVHHFGSWPGCTMAPAIFDLNWSKMHRHSMIMAESRKQK